MPNKAPQTPIRPNNAQIYKATYEAAYATLPPATKARVLDVMANNALKDERVETFIRGVITRAEAIIYDQEQEDIKKLKKEVDSKTSPK
jgi:hypothetical protein